MEKTYLQRAKEWVSAEADLDAISVKETIDRFLLQIREMESRHPGSDKVKDLKSTTNFLLAELGEDTVFDFEHQEAESTPPMEEESFSSMLVDHGPGMVREISDSEKTIAIASLKKSLALGSASDLLNRKENQPCL